MDRIHQAINNVDVVRPSPAVEPFDDRRERIDYFGNRVSYFEVVRAHDELRITSHTRVVVDPIRGQARIQATQSLGAGHRRCGLPRASVARTARAERETPVPWSVRGG